MIKSKGGALLGEGSKGIVYDLSGDESFYKWLTNQNIERIQLHGVGRVPVQEFIEYLRDKPNRIAKIIKQRTYKKNGTNIIHILDMLECMLTERMCWKKSQSFNLLL